MDSLLVTIAKFSGTMPWGIGTLFVADLAAPTIVVFWSGTEDQEEGTVVNEKGPLSASDRNAMGQYVTFPVTGLAKERVLLSRSSFISDDSLVDGTATKSQRLVVHGIRLAFLLFWLLIVFGVLSVLPSNPVAGLFVITIMSIIFFQAASLVRKGRMEVLCNLKRKVASRKDRKKT